MSKNAQKIGWIGTGRMGLPMAERLLKAGHDVTIWNRTRVKAEPLAAKGGKIVDKLSELASCDVVNSARIVCVCERAGSAAVRAKSGA